jgi:uncharacterized protein YggE
MAMPSKLEIHVSGSGQVTRRAERAILVLQACAEKLSTPTAATTAITHTASVLREAITPHCPSDEASDAAISHYSMTTLDTSQVKTARKELDEEGKKIYDTAYSARVDFHIKFANFDVLDKLATSFSTMENVRISSVSWRLTEDTLASIKGETRKLAARNAVQRAWDYAEVVGNMTEEEAKQMVKPVEIKEGSHYEQNSRPRLHVGKRQRMTTTEINSEELRFQPEDVAFEVTVNAKFVVDL